MVLRPKYDRMLEQFDRLYDNGIQVAWMAHFSTPREVLNPLTDRGHSPPAGPPRGASQPEPDDEAHQLVS